jgi:hypothetical protein
VTAAAATAIAAATAATTVAAATAATTASTTAAATAATTAATAVAAASTTATAASASAATLRLARLVDDDGATAERLTVELVDRGLRLAVVSHLDESEASRSSGVAIGHDFDLLDLTSAAALEECLD